MPTKTKPKPAAPPAPKAPPLPTREANQKMMAKLDDRTTKLDALDKSIDEKLADRRYASPDRQKKLQTAKADVAAARVAVKREQTLRAGLEASYKIPAGPLRTLFLRYFSEKLAEAHKANAKYYPKGADVADPGIKCLEKEVKSVKPGTAHMSPEAMQAVNHDLRTSVDFNALGDFEGGQYLDGYVPKDKNGNAIGRSGVTIGTGVDLGQHDEKWLNSLDLPDDLSDKLKPYLNKRKGDAIKQLDEKPLTITRSEADLVDRAVQKQFLESTMASWESHREENTPAFTDLTPAQQTVLLSRTYHQGTGMPDTAIAQDFYDAAIDNRWDDAETNLRNYNTDEDWYQSRVGREADLLKREKKK